MKRSMILAISLICAQITHTTCALSAQQKMLTNLAIEYCISMLSTTAHELGHALTSKLFWGSPIDITIGGLPTGQPQAGIKIGWLKIVGPYPGFGYANCRFPRGGASPIKAAIALLAGPICGIATEVLAYKLFDKCAPRLNVIKNAFHYSLWNKYS